MFDLIDL